MFQQFSASRSGVLLCTVSVSVPPLAPPPGAARRSNSCCVSGRSSQGPGPAAGHLDSTGESDAPLRRTCWPLTLRLFQYTPPMAAADYVHRVGRTARVGETGSSLLFLTPTETAFIEELANHSIR